MLCISEEYGNNQADGTDLVRDTDYTAEQGSTIIRIRPAYLEQLPAGEHTLTVVFDDGRAETKLIIRNADPAPDKGKGTSPDTGDSASAGVWFLLITASFFVFITGLKLRRRLSE